MTKYILHGGGSSDISSSNDKFFEEMVSSVPNGGSILCVYFARNEDDWDRLFEQDTGHFGSAADNKVVSVEIARQDTFVRQLMSSDLVYFRGGDMSLLENAMKQFPEFKSLVNGKVVSGSSGGAYLFSTYYYIGAKDLIKDGMGLIPAKVTAHYDGDKSILERLRKHGEDMDIILLAEGEFKVIEV